MANSASTIVTSFKRDLLNGLHAFGTSVIRASTDADVFKMALYLATASLSASTASYTATGEVNAGSSGYDAGGKIVTNATAPDLDGTTAFWTPSAALSWTSFTSGGAFDAGLLYNDTSGSNSSVAIFNFGVNEVTAGTFTLTMPTHAAATALLRVV